VTDTMFLSYLPTHRGEYLRPYVGRTVITLLRLLARGEAEGESDAGQRGVMWTAKNRAAHPQWWGATITQTVLWPQQFSCFWASYAQREHAIDAELASPTPQLIRAAIAVMSGDDTQDPTLGATYYWNPDLVTPAWASRVHLTVKIDHHQFARGL